MPSESVFSVPEEAIEAAREAAMRTGSTRASVEAAAPLILAAAYERVAGDLNCQDDYDLLVAMAGVLRGDQLCTRRTDQ